MGLLSTISPDNAIASGDARGLALTTAPSTMTKRGAKTLETILNLRMWAENKPSSVEVRTRQELLYCERKKS